MQQYMRKIELIIGDKSTGLLITELKINFTVEKTISKEPNKATIKIYNLPRQQLKTMEQKYKEVVLNAGYSGNVGNIFTGQITFWKTYKEDNDLVTELTCEDGARAFYHGKTNISVSKDTSDTEIIKRASKDFDNAQFSHVSPVNSTNRIRGRVISQPTRDLFSQMADKHGADWSFQDGKIVFINNGDTLNNQIVSLNYDSGLLNQPEQTKEGINVKCLLNPALKIAGKLQLKDTAITPYQSENKNKKTRQAKKSDKSTVSTDGIYKINKLTFNGDNYSTGSDFTADMEVVNV